MSNEINAAASSLSTADQTCSNEKNLNCVPCAYANDVRPTVPLMGLERNGEVTSADHETPDAVVVKKESRSSNALAEELKSKCRQICMFGLIDLL